MKLAAAYAIASCVGKEELSEDYIIPSVFNRKVAPAVAKEVSRAAHRTKVSGRAPKAYAEIGLVS
jgi:malate dehydrogenase (oxaloacetate-decarboxylating)